MSAKGNILLTGYEAFADLKVNPSIEACKGLEGKVFNGYKVVVEEIPMRYAEVKEIIYNHMDNHKPAAVVSTGVTGRGAAITVERVAINVGSSDGRMNFGYERLDQILNPDGPVAYWTRLPYRELIKALSDVQVPAILSNSAGTQGCNLLFYHLMDYVAQNKLDIPAGFIHIPCMPENVLGENRASMSLDLSTRALEVVVEYLAGNLP